MFRAGDGRNWGMSWEDQGRQEHGWFGHGTAPPRDEPLKDRAGGMFDPDNVAARIDAIAHAAIAHMPRADRHRESPSIAGGWSVCKRRWPRGSAHAR
jgi:hypothetical protein